MLNNPSDSGSAVRVGLISDTHGLLRPEAKAFLWGCVRIVHGGDIGGPEILDELQLIAPVSAVRGNNDTESWAQRIPETDTVSVHEIRLYAIHNLTQLDIDPKATGIGVVMSGHSHKPFIEHREGVLFVNPGSAGPRRFKLPVTLGELMISGDTVSARIVNLDAAARSASALI